MASIVKITTYVTDMICRADLAPLREEFLGKKVTCVHACRRSSRWRTRTDDRDRGDRSPVEYTRRLTMSFCEHCTGQRFDRAQCPANAEDHETEPAAARTIDDSGCCAWRLPSTPCESWRFHTSSSPDEVASDEVAPLISGCGSWGACSLPHVISRRSLHSL